MSDDEYEVLIVKYGTRSTVRSDVFLNYGVYGEPDAPIGMDYFWSGPYGRHAQFHHSAEDSELKDLAAAAAEGRVTAFGDRHQVAPGIEVRRVGGHTPGQSMVTVRTADGPALLASDAMHYYEECDRNMSFVSAANLVDMYAGFDTIRDLTTAGSAIHVVSGHDPGTLDRFPRYDGAPAGLDMAVIGGSPHKKEDR